ncbi:heat repeat protein [Ophiostoma piceae UAMH 11346]|uniref:Heat repeat protein n=1 Tax=Ophiostoma piceae (strain UAMH 11346) TaxID=1262450 RepID=S3BQB4_OPHP1|nr:heat repeat protein [Ophiostoma piceae UAMH 11346]
MASAQLPNIDDASVNANIIFAWLEQQPQDQTADLVEALFVQLLDRCSKSRVSSVNACAKLCGFVQHCARAAATTPAAASWAFRDTTTLRLFHFYIEWNEKDQHRSLKLVLDLVALLVTQNPDAATKAALRATILQTLVAIISHKSTRPLVKSSIGSLHHLLSKGVYQYEEVAQAYRAEKEAASQEEPDDATPAPMSIDSPSLDVWQQFVDDMFAWMTLHYVCPVAGKLLVAVFAYLRTSVDESRRPVFPGFTVDLWLQWLRDGLTAHPGILEDVKLYFFIPLFKADRTSSLQLLETLNKHSDASLGTTSAAVLQLAALEVGKKAGLVDDPGLNITLKPFNKSSKPKKKSNGIVLNEYVLDDVLGQASTDVRSLALSLLVSSQSTTKPYSSTAFVLLRKYLPGYHAESDAKFRYELLAHTRDMAVRLKSAILLMQRWLQAPTDPEEVDAVQVSLGEHETFLAWYLVFLRDELAPTASYQRHFTALKATSWLFRQRRDISGGAADALDLDLARRLFHDYAWVRCVLDLIMDPFDDVRETATSLLVLAPNEIVTAPIFPSPTPGAKSTLWDVLAEFSKRADARASQTARQDHADGAARCQGLLCSWAAELPIQITTLANVLDILEEKISKAEGDLGTAAVKFPVHGEFASIRYIWNVLAKVKYSDDELADLVTVQARIVRSCERIWHIVKHVLCDDSPEGHMPEDMEDAVGLDSKDLLSYSFRSINESSNTMRAIVTHLRFSRVKGMLRPDRAVFSSIGNLAFEQLSTLRHRGALTTVAQTFTLCCQLAQDPLVTEPGTPDDQTLIVAWYKGTLECIQSQISTTRRSAGIPGLFSGILASNAPSPTFEEAIRTACEIAQQPALVLQTDGSRLPQVHAFNCLRDVFRSSLLSKRAERLLPECLQLAANSLRSEVWAIRNCGLLLLRSLIDCLFGTGESKASLESGWDGRTIRVSYNKYPTLPGVLLSLLQTQADFGRPEGNATTHLQIESQQAAAESVFPALDIIRRAGSPETHRDELYRAVVHYLGSTLWHVREMAARTVCSFLIVQDWAAGIQSLLTDLGRTTESTANRLHGTLLAFRFVLARVAEIARETVPDKLPHLTVLLDTLAQGSGGFASCPEVRAAYLEARNTICGLAIELSLPLEDFVLPDSENTIPDSSAQDIPSALLKAQSVQQANYAAASRNDRPGLEALLKSVAVSDPDTATRLLDAIPESWSDSVQGQRSPDVASWLCTVYVNAGLLSEAAPLVRATALRHLADAMDYLLLLGPSQRHLLPSVESLVRLWQSLAEGDINPTLSWAILRASGPILASLQNVASSSTPIPAALTVSSWAAVIKSAGNVDQTFDTRMAAAEALRSFALAGTGASFSFQEIAASDLLPFVLCIYDSLNDDDDDIRDVAAEAAGAVLGKPLIPGEAARRLPLWMSSKFGGRVEGFAEKASKRMQGQPEASTGAEAAWAPAASLLETALQFDDALFLVEEHNLFIDEVREAERWGEVVEQQFRGDSGLSTWIGDGLEALVSRVKDSRASDGPLGWTAAPSVFAVCGRLIVGARSITRSGNQGPAETRLVSLLDEFRQAGEAARIHGLLLAMAKV